VLAGGILMSIVNATFDRSPAVYRPVQIENYWQTTHNGIIRTYEVEYTPFGAGKSEKHQAGIDDLAKLQDAETAGLEVHEGALGMEWISGIHPFRWEVPPDQATPEQLAQAITFEKPGENGAPPLVIRLIPVLVVDEKTTVPAPKELTDRESEKTRGLLGIPLKPAP
jgi:hypothetical protein